MRASVYLDLQHHVAPIDRRIFGGFLEHLGRCIYGGVFEPGHPTADGRGFRGDVLEALRPLGMTVMRYPGGNYVSAHDWRDGVGPVEARPRRPDFAWKSVEPNRFGVDEFMAWCGAAGVEPMMAVNLGTGNPKDAAELVEYCNLPAGTSWADRRGENGHPEPYGVKLWCLGNEMDGPWQAGHVPAEVYAQRAGQAAILMKGLDPGIETIVCGSSNPGMPTYLGWDRTVLEYTWPYVDYIAAHHYAGNARDDTPWFLAEGVVVDRVLEDYAGLLSFVRGVKKSAKRVYLSFDEWNVWYRERGEREHGGWKVAPPLLEEPYNLEDAIVCAQFLAAFIRRADLVKVACLAQAVNVLAPMTTGPGGVLKRTIYHPFRMISAAVRGLSLTPVVQSPRYRAGERGDVPVLDAAASYDPPTASVTAVLINRSTTEEVGVAVRLADALVHEALQAEAFGGGDPHEENTWDRPDAVAPREAATSIDDAGALHISVPPVGMAVATFRVRPRV